MAGCIKLEKLRKTNILEEMKLDKVLENIQNYEYLESPWGNNAFGMVPQENSKLSASIKKKMGNPLKRLS